MSKRFVAGLVVIVAAGVPLDALADDWGYEQEVKPARAVALPLHPVKKPAPVKAKVVAAKVIPTAPRSGPLKGATPPKAVQHSAAAKGTVSKFDLTVECWSQIYQLAAGRKLAADELKKLTELLRKSPNQGQAVLGFWPKVTDYLVSKPSQTENYSRLLRALLRWKARSAPAGSEAESAFISQILGPTRVAVQGTPAFSEEAVEAYADMACFLYEQSNPGKTIDAFDNRAMFASVVCEKFRNAPSDKDKQAMAAFDLAWAKFKVAWDGANETTRASMLAALQKTGANSANANVQDPVLKAVLENWKL